MGERHDAVHIPVVFKKAARLNLERRALDDRGRKIQRRHKSDVIARTYATISTGISIKFQNVSLRDRILRRRQIGPDIIIPFGLAKVQL